MMRKLTRREIPTFHQVVVGGRLNFGVKAIGQDEVGVCIARELTMPGLNVKQSFTITSRDGLEDLLKNDEFYKAHPVFFKSLQREALKFL
jgi:hypothetical protein